MLNRRTVMLLTYSDSAGNVIYRADKFILATIRPTEPDEYYGYTWVVADKNAEWRGVYLFDHEFIELDEDEIDVARASFALIGSYTRPEKIK